MKRNWLWRLWPQMLRQPVIFDLWGDIRFVWVQLDYYEKSGISKLASEFPTFNLPAQSDKTIHLYRYELKADHD